MNIVAVSACDGSREAREPGAPSVTLWILAWLLFFLPMALTLIELSSRYPEEGGMYRWARRAFGPVHGFSVRLVCLGQQPVLTSPRAAVRCRQRAAGLRSGAASLADSRVYSTAFVLGSLWVCVFLNLLAASRFPQYAPSRGPAALPPGLPASAPQSFARRRSAGSPLEVAARSAFSLPKPAADAKKTVLTDVYCLWSRCASPSRDLHSRWHSCPTRSTERSYPHPARPCPLSLPPRAPHLPQRSRSITLPHPHAGLFPTPT
jgi:hypothetical protein